MSYADFSTLLFAVFATMYAISSVDAQKLTKVAKGVQLAFDESSAERSNATRAGVFPAHDSRVISSLMSNTRRPSLGARCVSTANTLREYIMLAW